MKLSELIPHTSQWLGIPQTFVTSVARELRPSGLISSAGRGPGGAEMTVDDKINLLLGVCGTEIAKTAASNVRDWHHSRRLGTPQHPKNFTFLAATSVKDLIVNLITKDLQGGPLTQWLEESRAELKAALKGQPGGPNHELTLDFYVDEFTLGLYVSRNIYNDQLAAPFESQKVATDTIRVLFVRPVAEKVRSTIHPEYKASSRLIRRLNEVNLVGWGDCLNE